MTTSDRLERLREEQNRLFATYATLNEQMIHNQVLMQRGYLLEIAEADPTITRFSFDAQYEYDDEGGYYWTCSIFAHDAEGNILDLMDDLADAEHVGDETSTGRAFESNSRWDGSITVERLRELWGGGA